MNNAPTRYKRVLAISPNSRGFGFAVLEGPGGLIDWGVVQIRQDKHGKSLDRIAELVTRFEPNVVATEDPDQSPRRSIRIRRLLRGISGLADRTRIKWKGLSRVDVQHTFRSSVVITKYRIAQGIAERFPELGLRLPPRRKPWMSEDARMGIFDAVALALTFFQ